MSEQLSLGLSRRSLLMVGMLCAALAMAWVMTVSGPAGDGAFDVARVIGRVKANALFDDLLKIAGWLKSWWKHALATAALAAIGFAWLGYTMKFMVATMSVRGAATWATQQ